jgi:prolyl-tRNA synthetase
VRDDADVVARCGALTDELLAAGVRAHLDDRTELSLGRRATDWELKGVPLRLELGPRDLADNVVTMVRRASGTKAPADLTRIVSAVETALDAEQVALFAEATTRRETHTVDVSSLGDARAAAETGWARIAWDLVGTEGEAELAMSGVSVRCLTRADGSVPGSEAEPDLVAYVSRAY